MALEKFDKQPNDIQDYDISYVDWLNKLGDTGASHTVTADPGITVNSHTLNSGIVKVWLSGGTNGVNYKITAKLTTTLGRTKEAEIIIKVKET